MSGFLDRKGLSHRLIHGRGPRAQGGRGLSRGRTSPETTHVQEALRITFSELGKEPSESSAGFLES